MTSGVAKMTIAAHQDVGVGPVASQIGQQPNDDHGIFGSGRADTRTQGGRDQGMRRPLENEEWQIAMILIVMIIERQLLLAMRGIIRVVKIEHNSGRGLRVAGDAMIDQGGRKTIEVFAVYLVFQPRERGRTSQVVLGVQRGAFDPQLEHGVVAEMLGVIGVCIPRGDLIDTLGQQVP